MLEFGGTVKVLRENLSGLGDQEARPLGGSWEGPHEDSWQDDKERE